MIKQQVEVVMETKHMAWTTEGVRIGPVIPKALYEFLYKTSVIRKVSMSQVIRDILQRKQDSYEVNQFTTAEGAS